MFCGFFFPLLKDSLKSHSSFKLEIFVLCLYLMHTLLIVCLFVFYITCFLMFLQKEIWKRRRLFNLTSYSFKNRTQLTATFVRDCFYVMISSVPLSECLQPGYIIMICRDVIHFHIDTLSSTFKTKFVEKCIC